MAKKVEKDTPKDQHKGFMVRLPEEVRAKLDALKAKHRRPITTEVQIALEKHFKDEGV